MSKRYSSSLTGSGICLRRLLRWLRDGEEVSRNFFKTPTSTNNGIRERELFVVSASRDKRFPSRRAADPTPRSRAERLDRAESLCYAREPGACPEERAPGVRHLAGGRAAGL